MGVVVGGGEDIGDVVATAGDIGWGCRGDIGNVAASAGYIGWGCGEDIGDAVVTAGDIGWGCGVKGAGELHSILLLVDVQR